MHRALALFGAPVEGLSLHELTLPDLMYQIGVEPNRIDILTGIDGVAFESAWESRVAGVYGSERMWVIGIDELIRNKKTAARERDLIDVRDLERRGSRDARQ